MINCIHGLGLGHLIFDLLLVIPFVGFAIAGIKLWFDKFKKKKKNG